MRPVGDDHFVACHFPLNADDAPADAVASVDEPNEPDELLVTPLV